MFALESPPTVLLGRGVGANVVLAGTGIEVVGGVSTGSGVGRGGRGVVVVVGAAGLAGMPVGAVASAPVLVSCCPGVATVSWGLRQGMDASIRMRLRAGQRVQGV